MKPLRKRYAVNEISKKFLPEEKYNALEKIRKTNSLFYLVYFDDCLRYIAQKGFDTIKSSPKRDDADEAALDALIVKCSKITDENPIYESDYTALISGCSKRIVDICEDVNCFLAYVSIRIFDITELISDKV